MKEISGGYCSGVPPLPISNREVKPTCADGTAQQCGRVGSRLLLRSEALETEMSSGLFCVFNRFICLFPSFSRIAFGIVWCCSCLFSVLPLEFSCVYSAFSLCCLRNPLFLVLFLFHICIISVSYLYCLCFTFVRFLFRIYVAFLFVLCSTCVISMMA